MLKKLNVKNYALIQDLQLKLNSGFLTITGETGAGKSILLGALGMIQGNRADLKAILNKDNKCSVEAVFNIENYNLNSFFTEFDLDYEKETIIRREISTSGKSRSFINDTPVSLTILQKLGKRLIDIHSQHDTSEIIEKSFQLDLLDYAADQMDKRFVYEKKFHEFSTISTEITELNATLQELKNTQDYNTFLLEELQKAQFQEGEQKQLEEELELLSNAEGIKMNLSKALQIHSSEQVGLQSILLELKNSLIQVASYNSQINDLANRVESISIETEDIMSEVENLNESIEYNPTRINEVNDRLHLIYGLQKKHQADDIKGLIDLMNQLASKASDYSSIELKIEKLETKKALILKDLEQKAKELNKGRAANSIKLTDAIGEILTQVEMPNAQLKLQIKPLDKLSSTGKDDVEILFSANKGGTFNSIKKAASGGERSRLMLAIKKVMAEKQQLPTLILDEIDTGVSGKIASQMGLVMKEMANNIQMISVTHLPQIAAKGNQHFKVFKESDNNTTQTQVKELNQQERIQEIAQMISGDSISSAAEAQAKELLG